MRRLIKELLRYLKNNQDSLANYGRRYRSGRRISTAFVESAVNQLIDKRMSKSQQMRWSPIGSHALLRSVQRWSMTVWGPHFPDGIQALPGKANHFRSPHDPTI